MVYLLETKLLETKSIYFALSSIYGIGNKKSLKICKKLGFSVNLKVQHLSEEQVVQILKVIEMSNFMVTSELKKMQQLIIKHLISIKSYRGLRRIKGLPVRGQRTHTNAKTARKIK